MEFEVEAIALKALAKEQKVGYSPYRWTEYDENDLCSWIIEEDAIKCSGAVQSGPIHVCLIGGGPEPQVRRDIPEPIRFICLD